LGEGADERPLARRIHAETLAGVQEADHYPRPNAPSVRDRLRIGEENVTQPRAADDFAAIRARMQELAREAAETAATENGSAAGSEKPPAERGRQRDRREGHPPPWAPTIFTKPLTGRR
jgi:hypothetical protein